MMQFTDSSHTYVNLETNERYTSMTGLISSFAPKKDWDEIAANYLKKFSTKELLFEDLAKKAKLSLEQVEKKWGVSYQHSVEWIRSVWKVKSEESLEGGSYFHSFKELEASKLPNVIYNPVQNDTKNSIDLTSLKPGFTYVELMVFLHKYKMIGQIDRVDITKRNTTIVRDFKSNEKPITSDVTAFYNPKLKRKVVEKFISPISHLPTTDYYKYALQLSGYGYILEQYGFPPEALIIDQVITKTVPMSKVKPTDLILFEDVELELARIFVKMADPIEVPYLRAEIEAIFNYNKLKLDAKVKNKT
jgi:PD-(D/E)XK nuclease superfamily